jgi:synaptobrevin homolog YKT6
LLKNSYNEFMMLFCKTVAERTHPGQRQDIEEKSYTFHAYGRTEGVAGVIITDGDYPALVAHQLLSKVVDEFLAKYPRTAFSASNVQDKSCPLPQLKEYIVKYQDPSQADSIMKIQRELDDTKIVLHKTIESVLERGEKIDSLVAKSDGLSAQSKMFYTQVCRCTNRRYLCTWTDPLSRPRNRILVALSCEVLKNAKRTDTISNNCLFLYFMW